jgi:hypothetical protein
MLKPTFVVLLLAVAGCAGGAVPNARLASSVAAVRGAREVGAESIPAASLYVRFSDEEIAKAKNLIANGDNDAADFQLQRAQADAELALSMARESTAQNQAQQSVNQTQNLRAQESSK